MTEHERSSLSVNQQLQDYMLQLQSDVGSVGKTLHQVISHYLLLKEQNPELARALDPIDVPQAEQTSQHQFDLNRALIRQLQILSEKALQGYPTASEHPWKGFAHFEHRDEDSESFVRLMRFVGIQLNKFWVEVQSFPIFLNGLPHLSVGEVESIFRWLQACPSWKENVQQTRLIPALIGPESRKVVFDFARDVKSARVLHDKLASEMSSEFLSSHLIDSGVTLLTQGCDLSRLYELGACTRKDLIHRIDFLKQRVAHVKQIREVFEALGQHEGVPAVERPSEVRTFLDGVDCLRRLPKNLIAWRLPRILNAPQYVRLQMWKDRARPLLESRKRLANLFRLDDVKNSEKLRETAFHLSSGGMFRVMSSSYQKAVQAYRDLLRPEWVAQAKKSATRLQMSEKLLEWANFLEQSAAFESQPDLKVVFGDWCQGLDTDFTSAIGANLWATQVREQLKPDYSSFGRKWTDYIFSCSEKSIDQVFALTASVEADLRSSLQLDPEFLKDREFASIQLQDENELADLMTLLNVILRVGYREDGVLLGLESCRDMLGEAVFLMRRMEENADLKAAFRNSFRGVDTDLSLIDQAISYIQFIESSSLPDLLRESFLTAQGPQRIEDSKGLLQGAHHSLSAVREHLERLNHATQGQIQEWVQGPLPELMTRIQSALKQPALLPDWVEYLRAQQEVRQRNLGAFLHFLETRSGLVSYDLAYEIAFYASLLKRMIGNPGNATAILDLKTFH